MCGGLDLEHLAPFGTTVASMWQPEFGQDADLVQCQHPRLVLCARADSWADLFLSCAVGFGPLWSQIIFTTCAVNMVEVDLCKELPFSTLKSQCL